MRIDSPLSFSSVDRSTRPGTAVTPLREIQREQEQRRELPTTPASSQGLETVAQPRRVQPGNASSDSQATRQELVDSRGLEQQGQSGPGSYGSTASFTVEGGAAEVLGLDLYA
jgi:hypothetical protein